MYCLKYNGQEDFMDWGLIPLQVLVCCKHVCRQQIFIYFLMQLGTKCFWQLFTFNNHKTSHVETFVTTRLHWSKSNTQSNLNIEKRFSTLSIQCLKKIINSYENTQIMIITSREKYSLCNQLDTLAPKTKKSL